MSKEKRLFWSLSTNYVRMGFDVVVILLTTPLLLLKLGSDGYGRWIVLLSFFQILSQADLGLNPYLFKLVASKGEKGDRAIAEVFQAQLLLVLLGMLMTVVTFSLWWHSNSFLLLLCISSLAMIPFRLCQAILNGSHLMAATNIGYLVGRIFFAVSLGIAAFLGKLSLPLVCSVFLISQWGECLLSLFYALYFKLVKLEEVPSISLRKSIEVWKRAKAFFFIGLSGNILTRVEPILLSALFGYKVVALYDVAWKLSLYFYMFCRQVIHAFSPSLAEQGKEFYSSLRRTLQAVGLVATPLLLFALIYRESLFLAWLGEVHPSTVNVFIPLLLSAFFTLIQCTLSTAMSLQGRAFSVACYLPVRGGVMLGLSTLSAWIWGWEFYAYGGLVAVLLTDVVFFLPFAVRQLSPQMPLTRFSVVSLLESLLQKTFLPLIGMFVVVFFSYSLQWSNAKLHILIHSSLEVGTYGLIYLLRYPPPKWKLRWNT